MAQEDKARKVAPLLKAKYGTLQIGKRAVGSRSKARTVGALKREALRKKLKKSAKSPGYGGKKIKKRSEAARKQDKLQKKLFGRHGSGLGSMGG